MTPVIISNDMIARMPDGITMESSHIAKLQLPGLNKQDMQIHFFPQIKTALLISLGLLCDDVSTITLDKQDMSVQNNRQEIIKGTRKKQTEMWEVTLETQKSEDVANKILAQKNKPELAQYLHASLFISKRTSLLKASKQGLLKTWSGLTENIIKKHLEKSTNTTMGKLHMRRQVL